MRSESLKQEKNNKNLQQVSHKIHLVCNPKRRRGRPRRKFPQDSQQSSVMDMEIIETGWKAKEQIMLLDFIQMHGFGNWEMISTEMRKNGGQKTEEEIQRHYYTSYLQNIHFLPIFLDQRENNSTDTYSTFKQTQEIQPSISVQLVLQPKRQSLNTPMVSIDTYFNHHLDLQIVKARDEWFDFTYNPHRHELEEDYDKQCQNLISDLQFHDDDTLEERKIKFQLISSYNQRLRKRDIIKDIVIQHRFLQRGFQSLIKILNSQQETVARRQFLYLSRYMEYDEYNELIDKIVLLRQIRKNIVGLRRIRKVAGNKPFTSITRQQFRKFFRKFIKKEKANIDFPKPTEKKLDLLLQQEMKLGPQESKKLIRLIKRRDLSKIQQQFNNIVVEKHD